MKSNQYFGEDQAIALNDRVIELDRKFGVVISRIQAYDQILTDFSKIQQSLIDMKSAKEAQSHSLVNLSEALGVLQSQSANRQTSTLASIEQVSAKTFLLQKTVEENRSQMASRLEELHVAIAGVDTKHTKHSLQFIGAKEMANALAPFTEALKSVQERIEKHRIYLDSLEKKHTLLEEKFVDLSEWVLRLSSDHETTRQKLSDCVKNADRYMKNLKDHLDGVLEQSKKEIEASIAKAKVEMMGSPSSLESVRNEILSRLEMTSLDSTNASLKVANNEHQIKLLDKRLETLAILIKKNEFSKMG